MEDRSPTETRVTPQEFLAQVAAAEPGWSQQHGGPLGIAAMCADLQAQLVEQSEAIAAVRTAAIQQELTHRSGVQLANLLGVSKTAISKATRSNSWKDPLW